MQPLDRIAGAEALSVFANDVERLQVRMEAAGHLGLVLARFAGSRGQGHLRTALIKCELAAKYSQSHRDVDERFYEVSRLLYQAQVDFSA